MGIPWKWRRFRMYRQWKQASTPVLLNTETGELVRFSTFTKPSSGTWLLRRPLTLSESTLPLFLTVPILFR